MLRRGFSLGAPGPQASPVRSVRITIAHPSARSQRNCCGRYEMGAGVGRTQSLVPTSSLYARCTTLFSSAS